MTKEQYTKVKEVSFGSTTENLVLIEEMVDEVCAECGIKEDHYGNVLIAVTEAVNNAIMHGNMKDVSRMVTVEVLDNEENVQIVVKDEGEGFDYKNLPDPTAPENIEKLNGRGIFLMRNLADQLEFDDNGSKVVMEFSKQ